MNDQISPTVVPVHPFYPDKDAEILRVAMKGLGTDERPITNVLTKRSNEQRQQIASHFKTMYAKDLIKELKSELSGNFEDLIIALMTPLHEYYAKELQHAISGMGTTEAVLIEVLCTLSNNEIELIKDEYKKLFKTDMEKDIKGYTSGSFRDLMTSLAKAARAESLPSDPQAATQDAKALVKAREATFNQIFCHRSHAHLELVFQEYHRIAGHDIERFIKKELSGNCAEALLAIVRSIRNKPALFARLLNKCMKGLGVDNNRELIRLTLTRCEKDMEEIKREYAKGYKESLADAIKNYASGEYKKCLLGLIGEL